MGQPDRPVRLGWNDYNRNMNTETCAICGWKLVEARGKYPGYPTRLVCPTCLASRMDDIWDISHPDYGKAFQAEPKAVLKGPAPLAGGVALASDGQNRAETPKTP